MTSRLTARLAVWPLALLVVSASAAVSMAGSGCSRTPPEPAPPASAPPNPASTTTTASAGANGVSASDGSMTPTVNGGDAGRCITPLSAKAPAIPAAASPPTCPADPEPDMKWPNAVVAFPDSPDKLRVDVELALNEHDIQRGLMYRRSMPEMRGMLFKLDERRDHTFWMHNTCIPLDIMFVDEDGLIVGIVESAKPLDDTSRSLGCSSTHVLEVNAGWARKHGVAPGQRLGIPKAAR